jgi:hypothetical protein
MVNCQRGCSARKAWGWLALAVATGAGLLAAACGAGGAGETPVPTAAPTAVPTVTADLRDYTNFSPEAAMLTVDDLPPGFNELQRRPPALTGSDIVSGALFRFAPEGGTRYAYSEVVLLTEEAKPVVEDSLRTMMKGLGFPDVRSATVDYPMAGSTLVVGVGSSDLLGLGGPADTDVVFEVLSFAEGRVMALVGTAYPVNAPREPSSEALARIVLDRIRAQIGDT